MATSALTAGRGPLGRIFSFSSRSIFRRAYATAVAAAAIEKKPFKVSDYISPTQPIPPHPKPVSTAKRIKTYPPTVATCPVNAVLKFQQNEINLLDPTREKRKYFARRQRRSFQPGDILQVRFKDRNVEPFAGVLINIRRRGVDTGFLLRGNMSNLGVEMWYKVYSPTIESVQLLQRAAKRARRAKLYYMRDPKHDFKDVAKLAGKYNESMKVLRHLRRDLEDAAAASKARARKK